MLDIFVLAGPKTVTDTCYLCISWSKNSHRCLLPCNQLVLKQYNRFLLPLYAVQKQWQMLVTFVSAGSKIVTDAWYLLYQLIQKQWQMLDTLCISRSKNMQWQMLDSWHLLYQLAQKKLQMLDTLCISRSKNSDNCLLPLYQLVQKQWQMLDTFCISWFKNSDRCAWYLLYQLAQEKAATDASKSLNQLFQNQRANILWIYPISIPRFIVIVSSPVFQILQSLYLSSSSNKNCKLSSVVFSILSNVLLQSILSSLQQAKRLLDKKDLYTFIQ